MPRDGLNKLRLPGSLLLRLKRLAAGRLVRLLAIPLGLAIPVAVVIFIDWSAITAGKVTAAAIAERAAAAAVRELADPRTAALSVLAPDEKATLTVERGTLAMGQSPANDRFQKLPEGGDSIKVTAALTVKAPFSDALGFGRYRVNGSAIARRYGSAAVIMATTGEPLRHEVVNAMLSRLLNGDYRLSPGQIKLLQANRIEISSLISALSLQARMEVTTLGDITRSRQLPATFLKAMAATFVPDDPVALLLVEMAEAAGPGRPLMLTDLIDLAPLNDLAPDAPLPALPTVSAMDLITTILRLQAIGDRLEVDIPSSQRGLEQLSLTLAVERKEVQPPAMRYISEGDVAELPPVTMNLVARISGSTIPGAPEFSVPIAASLFGGEARLRRVACNFEAPDESRMQVAASRTEVLLSFATPGVPIDTKDPAAMISTRLVHAFISSQKLIGDEPVAVLDFQNGGEGARSQSVASEVEFISLLTDFLLSAEVLVEADDKIALPAGTARDELAGLIRDHAEEIAINFQHTLAMIGISPARVDVAAGSVDCSNSRIEH